MLKEVVDNGLMVKRLENYVDGQRLTKERSVMDFTRPDWQKVEE
jgi:alpha-glucosidase (family GH31 glycosyl hydrolase)